MIIKGYYNGKNERIEIYPENNEERIFLKENNNGKNNIVNKKIQEIINMIGFSTTLQWICID